VPSRGGLLAKFEKPGVLWAAVFLYTVLAGLFVQLILLPHVLPSWHAGNGLLRGIDAPQFHRIAIELTQKVRAFGWSQWTLAPDNQPVAGMAALAYLLVYPAPWALLPLNGVLHALASVGIFVILRRFAPDASAALLATLPFVFFPSNLVWNSQMHNENYAVPGVVAILLGWTLIAAMPRAPLRRVSATSVAALAFILTGSFLLGMVRHLILDGMTYLFMMVGAALAVLWLLRRPGEPEYSARVALMAGACGAMLLAGIPKFEDGGLTVRGPLAEQEGTLSESKNIRDRKGWLSTEAIPAAVDRRLSDLAAFRNRFVRSWEQSGSGIDTEVVFHNAAELAAYVPRALQIGLFSPFPALWFTSGDAPAGSGMRIASAFEMMLAYTFLLGLPMFMWRCRDQPAVWVILFVCVSMLAVYATIIPNVGALYRFRYPYFMPLVCMGLLGWISLFRSRSARGGPGMPA
jgi:putative peptidoglycan lipid II flippase